MYADLALEHHALKEVLSRKAEPGAATGVEPGGATPSRPERPAHWSHAGSVPLGEALPRVIGTTQRWLRRSRPMKENPGNEDASRAPSAV